MPFSKAISHLIKKNRFYSGLRNLDGRLLFTWRCLQKKIDKKFIAPFIDENMVSKLLTARNALGDLYFKPQDLVFMSKGTIEKEYWAEFLKSLVERPPIAELMILKSVYGAPENLDREANRIHDKAIKILMRL